VGDPAGTIVERNPEPAAEEASSLSDLSAALGRDDDSEDEGGLVEAGADLVDEASAATAEVEKAAALGRGLARGEALDPAQLGFEVDAVLGLLERLDRQGRWKEALRLARALSTLYSLLRRWAALLRSLRAALRAGKALSDQPAVGWALHELGTLKLAAGDVGGAARDLHQARMIRERVGERAGIVATDRNLRALCEQMRGRGPDVRRFRVLRVSLPLAVLAALLLLAAGIAGGVAAHRVATDGDGGGNGPGPAGSGNETVRLTVTIEGAGAVTANAADGSTSFECYDDGEGGGYDKNTMPRAESSACSQEFAPDEAVELTAIPESSWYLELIEGCDETEPCRLTMDSSRKVTVVFETNI
jgi:hypothetical protein